MKEFTKKQQSEIKKIKSGIKMELNFEIAGMINMYCDGNITKSDLLEKYLNIEYATDLIENLFFTSRKTGFLEVDDMEYVEMKHINFLGKKNLKIIIEETIEKEMKKLIESI